MWYDVDIQDFAYNCVASFAGLAGYRTETVKKRNRQSRCCRTEEGSRTAGTAPAGRGGLETNGGVVRIE